LISILGLAVGLACSLLIFLYVLGEVGWNSDIKNSERIYRVLTDTQWAGVVAPQTPYPLASAIKAQFAEVETVARVSRLYGTWIKLGDEYVNEHYFVSADPEIFDLFSLNVVHGDAARLLEDPNSVAISERAAARYFGDENPLDKVLSVMVGQSQYELRVTGVFEDFPRKSTLYAQFIAPLYVSEKFTLSYYRGMEINLNDAWTDAQSWTTYLLTAPPANPANLQEKLSALAATRYGPDNATDFMLQPLNDVYFHSGHLANNNVPQGNLTAIYVLVLIAVSILALACVNYVILSSAQTMTRLNEIGVRKVVGASRSELIVQILGESVLLALLSLPLAVVLMELALPHVNELFRMRLQIGLLSNWPFTVGMFLVTLTAGLASGAYVAIYQSAAQPVEVLRHRFLVRVGRFNLRRCLVVLQLIVFVALVSCAGIVYLQVHYAMNRDPGFDRENLLLASPGDPEFARKYELFKNEALAVTDVISVTSASEFPPTETRAINAEPSAADPSVRVPVEGLMVDYDFVKTMGLTLVEGRGFSRDMDQHIFRSIILNEAAVTALGYKSPVEETAAKPVRIVGVVKDFNIHSVRSKIEPLKISLVPEYAQEVAVRIKPGRMDAAEEQLNLLWKKHFPEDTDGFYSYREALPYLYTDEKRGYVALVAVLICCMGLFGLSLFVSRGRTKEIGIRKVFGASTSSVTGLLVREYVWLVVIATALSVPVTYYFMSRWLENFVYRMSIGWYVFAAAGLVALLVALATVGIQALRAARANPTDSLRYE